MRALTDTIAEHTGTGASTTIHELGSDSSPGAVGGTSSSGIASTIRHIHVTGIAGGSVVKIEGSMDASNWVDWITSIEADGWFIINDGPRFIRSNCTTHGSGTVTVQAQKFVD
jgi:hypothetical protein